MGFFQRFLSLGSRKGKKRRAALTSASTAGFETRTNEHEHDAEASKLLRTSSLHFKVVSEADYSSLPPLPDLAHGLLPAPTPSPARSSVQSKGHTYSVKILGGREVLSTTEFPNANPPLHTPPRRQDEDDENDSDSVTTKQRKRSTVTPRDESRIRGLRRDPSVASLLNMYDDDGRLDSTVFSNSPEKHGRAQIQRSGSTLRQLLGDPQLSGKGPRYSTAEGDISWAERFLRESEPSDEDTGSSSELDSPALNTPKDQGSATEPVIYLPGAGSITISTEQNESVDCSGFNSLEVELSTTSDDKPELAIDARDPPTPSRPASEVFGFLLERKKSNKKSTAERKHDIEHPLPALPLSAESLTDGSSSHPTATPQLHPEQPSPSHSHGTTSSSSDGPSSAGSIFEDPPSCAQIMNRTPVLFATGTGREQPLAQPQLPVSRIPRGPRGPRTSAHIKRQSTGSIVQSTSSTATATTTPKPSLIPIGQRDALRSAGGANSTAKKPANVYTPVPARRPHRRAASSSSAKSVPGDSVTSRRSSKTFQGKKASKENVQDDENAFVPKFRLPTTPTRPLSLFDPPRNMTPSPASSSELSPVGQRMMADLRSQRKVAENRFAQFVLIN